MNKSYTRSKLRKDRHLSHFLPRVLESPLDPTITRFYSSHPFYFDDDLLYHRMDSDDELPLTKQLEHLLHTVHPRQKYYVYDVYHYDLEKNKKPLLSKMTENTLRIGVISPMIFGIAQQNEDILNWAVARDLLPKNWKSPDAVQVDVSDSMRTNIQIVDAFVQCLLRTDSANLVKISYHIGEWYNFSKKRADHTMNKKYELKELKKDLQKMMLLQSIWLIYTDVPKELIWYIAVFVCHQYFFYLADSEYKRHSLLAQLEEGHEHKDAKRLKDEGNAHYKADEYSEAIKKYGQALKMSPYNHQLYANRAISYLKLKEIKYASRPSMANKCAISAMSDAFRCIKLNPLYAKGHDRYAVALKELGHRADAVKALEAAIQTMKQSAPEKEIRLLEIRLGQYSGESKPRKKRAVCDTSGIATNGDSNQDASNSLSTPGKSDGKSHDAREKHDNEKFSAHDELSDIEDQKDSPGIMSSASNNGVEGNDKGATSKNNHVSQTSNSSRPPKRSAPPTSTRKNAKEAACEPFKALTEDLQRTMKNGSEALLEKKYRFAINLYDRCFKLTQESTPQNLGQTVENMLVLRYARCVAYINVGPNEDIVMGISELTQLLDHQPSQTMKAIALYELGNAYVKKHRYTCAIELVTQALQLCERKKGLREAYCWPGTQTFIEHTDKTVLKAKLAVLIAECKNPPQPDFLCLSDLCTSYGYVNSSIYINDPDFRGYVCVSCSEKCLLRYHRDCWRKKHHKVNTACITPDCGGLIVRWTEYDEQAQRCSEDKADIKHSKSHSKVLKMKPSSVKRIAEITRKKQERKEKRAEKKQQRTMANDSEDGLADAILASAKKKEADAPAAVNLNSSNFVVKQKNREEDMSQQVPRKAARNKVKSRNVMSLDEFYAPFLHEENTSNMSSGSISLSGQLKDEVARFEKDYHMEKLPVVIQGVSVDKLKESVLDFYYDLLESDGPMAADSPELLDFLKGEQAANELVQHCHGLSRFLLSSGRFSQIENIICVRRESDEKKAKQMVDAVRNTSHGVAVVSSDFKENLARAADYKPERKKYSGYDTVTPHYTPHAQDQEQWRAVIQNWSADDSSLQTREQSSTSASIALSDVDSELADKQKPAKVEPLSPGLREAWIYSQDQRLVASLNNMSGKDELVSSFNPPCGSASLETFEVSPPSNTDSALGQLTNDNSSSHNSDGNLSHPPSVSSQLLGSSASVIDSQGLSTGCDEHEAFPSGFAREVEMGGSDYSPFGDSSSTKITNPYADNFMHFQPSAFMPSYSNSGSLTHQQLAATSTYADASPFLPLGQQPFAYAHSNAVAPIGTPARSASTTFATGQSLEPHSDQLTGYDVSGVSAASMAHDDQLFVDQGMHATFKKAVPDTSDKQCNTEYEYMDDYDKKIEECVRLHERIEHLEDKFTQLKQQSSVQLHDLQGKLEDAINTEKTTRDMADKQQQQMDREMRKWKEERKALIDEVNSLKQMCEDRQHRAERAESNVTELESSFNSLRISYRDETERREADARQYQSEVKTLKTQLTDTQLEVINERERHALSNLEELLANTMKSIAEQYEQVARLRQNSNGEIPPIVRRNAELSSQRKERLLAVKREQQSLYESQRDVVRSGTLPLSKIPKLSPPGLMEIMASTAMPRPPLIPMMNMRPHVRPNVTPHMVPRMHPPQLAQPRMPIVSPPPVAGPPLAGPHGDNNDQGSDATRAAADFAASKGQSRRNVENQLIQDINNVFPSLTGDDIRAYISRLRETRQGLTGLKVVELKRQIVELVLQDTTIAQRVNSVGDECSICHERLYNGSALRILDCGHQFHSHCIGGWEQRESSCPICRRQIT